MNCASIVLLNLQNQFWQAVSTTVNGVRKCGVVCDRAIHAHCGNVYVRYIVALRKLDESKCARDRVCSSGSTNSLLLFCFRRSRIPYTDTHLT